VGGRVPASHLEGPIVLGALLPEPDLTRIAHFAEQPDQHAALRAFRDELRSSP
jgi:hypothetical protein